MYVNCRFKAYKGLDISKRISELSEVVKSDGYITCVKAFEETRYEGKVLDEMKPIESDSLASVAIIFVFDTSSLLRVQDELNPCFINTSIIKVKSINSGAFSLCMEADESELGLLIYACRDIIQNSHLLESCKITPDSTDSETLEIASGLSITIKTTEEV